MCDAPIEIAGKFCEYLSNIGLGGGGGGVLQKKLGRGVRQLPKTLTLFKTKICDFPYPIYD